jgi:hypothetical protein
MTILPTVRLNGTSRGRGLLEGIAADVLIWIR